MKKLKNKIIRLSDKKESLVNFLKDVLEMAENGEIEKIMIASFKTKKDDDFLVPEVLTGYYDLEHFERQYLLSSLQMDLAYSVVKSNIDELIEIINRW